MTGAEKLAPAVAGPNVSAVIGTFEEILDTTIGRATEIVSALDTRDPVWDSSRPQWHLTLIELEAGVVPIAGMSDADRYRRVRMLDVSTWSQGLWSDFLRLAAAWMRVEYGDDIDGVHIDPQQLRVFAWCLSTTWLFSPAYAPAGDMLQVFRDTLLATIQDVAGYLLIVGVPSLVFTFDLGPGFDVGAFGEIIAQEG